jgi:hypothetical protein
MSVMPGMEERELIASMPSEILLRAMAAPGYQASMYQQEDRSGLYIYGLVPHRKVRPAGGAPGPTLHSAIIMRNRPHSGLSSTEGRGDLRTLGRPDSERYSRDP